MKKLFFILMIMCVSFANAQIRELSQEEFFEKVLNKYDEGDYTYKDSKPCVVLFFSPYCPYSKKMETNIQKVSKKYKEKVNFYKINVFKIEDFVIKIMKIQGVPSLGLFTPDTKIDESFETYGGVATIEELEEGIKYLLEDD